MHWLGAAIWFVVGVFCGVVITAIVIGGRDEDEQD